MNSKYMLFYTSISVSSSMTYWYLSPEYFLTGPKFSEEKKSIGLQLKYLDLQYQIIFQVDISKVAKIR